jgi:hypothetical protein
MDLLKKSKQLKQEADKVIQLSQVEKVFSKLGKVKYVGSYELDLLYRRDIDIFVISEKQFSKEKALKITHELLNLNIFQTIGFANCKDYNCKNHLPAFYWELIYFLNGNAWKFDIWYTDVKTPKTIKLTSIIKQKIKETPNARKKILEMKQKFCNGKTYNQNMNGFKIYKKVLGELKIP